MRKLIVIVRTSLDGFVAGTNGDFLTFAACEETLEFVCRLARNADAALLDRVSFAQLNAYWPARNDHPDATWNEVVYSHWYNTATKYVVSVSLPPAAGVVVLGSHWQRTVSEIKTGTGKNILVFGSPSLVQALLEATLIDECWLFVNPVIFGRGVPLFSGREATTRFRLQEAKTFDNGEVALRYSRLAEGV